MSSMSLVFGTLLILLGVGGYFLTGTSSFTALIPALFGVLLVALGFLARADAIRMHAMHAAAAVALVGLLGALVSLMRTPLGLRPITATVSQVAMVVLTGTFLALAIRSFVAARRARARR